MATSNNNINTNSGNSLLNSVTSAFTEHPYLNQVFNEDVVQCAKDNALNDCDNPPSLLQLDLDINKGDGILEFLLLNDKFDRETLLFQFQVIVKFLKTLKCIHGQHPCFANELYLQNKEYLDNFEFFAS